MRLLFLCHCFYLAQQVLTQPYCMVTAIVQQQWSALLQGLTISLDFPSFMATHVLWPALSKPKRYKKLTAHRLIPKVIALAILKSKMYRGNIIVAEFEIVEEKPNVVDTITIAGSWRSRSPCRLTNMPCAKLPRRSFMFSMTAYFMLESKSTTMLSSLRF